MVHSPVRMSLCLPSQFPRQPVSIFISRADGDRGFAEGEEWRPLASSYRIDNAPVAAVINSVIGQV